jgi:hypothetical protein
VADFLDILLLVTWVAVSAAFVSWIVLAWRNTRGRKR